MTPYLQDQIVQGAIANAVNAIGDGLDYIEYEDARAVLLDALDAVPRQWADAWLDERDEARAEADRLRESRDEAIAERDLAIAHDRALWWAALDAEDGDGLTEIARISEDADLYRKTEGIIIRREGESNACCS